MYFCNLCHHFDLSSTLRSRYWYSRFLDRLRCRRILSSLKLLLQLLYLSLQTLDSILIIYKLGTINANEFILSLKSGFETGNSILLCSQKLVDTLNLLRCKSYRLLRLLLVISLIHSMKLKNFIPKK